METKSNIIKFKKKEPSINDDDITSLFLGLITLVKRKAVADYYKIKQKEIDYLRRENQKLKTELSQLKSQLFK